MEYWLVTGQLESGGYREGRGPGRGARRQRAAASASFAALPERLGAQLPLIATILALGSSLAKPGEIDLHIAPTRFKDESSPTGANFILAIGLVRPTSRGRL